MSLRAMLLFRCRHYHADASRRHYIASPAFECKRRRLRYRRHATSPMRVALFILHVTRHVAPSLHYHTTLDEGYLLRLLLLRLSLYRHADDEGKNIYAIQSQKSGWRDLPPRRHAARARQDMLLRR